MKIVDLVEKFKDRNNVVFNYFLNEIANYVMFEQAMIKKDNGANPTIKYRYDEKSYEYINDFISKITFSPKLKIGKGKKVNIKGMPDELYFELKHEMSFSDKIYILDKIKDSFMHLRDDNTMFDFDHKEGCIVIKNIADDFSLECKIPIKALFEFNRKIKRNYDKSAPSFEWIDEFLNSGASLPSRVILSSRSRKVDKFNDFREIKASAVTKAILNCGNGDFMFLQKNLGSDFDNHYKVVTKATYESYHTDSYVALLMASMDEMNYPLLNELYYFDFHCDHPQYKNKMEAIMKYIYNFYASIYFNIDYLNQDDLRKKIMQFIYRYNQNGEETGILVDISQINNMIIKSFLRNARSHANIKETEESTFHNPIVVYHDVLYNSLLGGYSDKCVPSFVMVGSKKKFDKLFDKITVCSESNSSVIDKIKYDFSDGKDDTLEEFLNQFELFINQAYKDKISGSEHLILPIGNASNFVDFLRKILNGTFEYEEGKGIGQR